MPSHNTTVTLLPFGTATYTAVALVDASPPTGSLADTVTVVPSAGTTDPNLANNTATDTDVTGTSTPIVTTATSSNVTLSASSVTLSDSATLSGGSNPTGTITFTLIGPGGLIFDTETVVANGNGTYATPTGFTLPNAGTVVGTYSWNATYSGDLNNHGVSASPEPTVVSPASPSLSTTASPGGVAGTTLTDIAQLSGGYFPTGTITFQLTDSAGVTVDTEISAVNGNGTYATPTGFTLPAGTSGTWDWHATYSGNSNNNVVTANSENVIVGVNPFPPPGTTADMILRGSNTSPIAGHYEIYDIGNNAILAASVLGQVGADFQFAGLGRFFGSDTTDMLLRSATSGGFEVYDIANNNITNATFLGTVGLDWQVMGFGNFSSRGENDMILRNSGSGGIEVYDISNNAITGDAFMGTVGLNWQVAGFSSHGTETDMVLRDTGVGGLEIYDINNNAITGAASLGAVGLDWQVSGFGDFSSRTEGDMLLRNVNTGGLELYDISNNQITGAFFLGNIGFDWRFAGIGPMHGAGTSDLVLRNVKTGQFEVYDIVNNQITAANSLGAVGLDFQVGGFAVDPPTGAMGGADNSPASTSQVVQAMAAFGSGSGTGESLNTAPLGADASQQSLLTAPHA